MQFYLFVSSWRDQEICANRETFYGITRASWGPSRYPRLGLTEEEDQKLQAIISKIAAHAAV